LAESGRSAGEVAQLGARRFSAARLSFGHSTLHARDEAIYLLLHALDLPPDNFDPSLKLTPQQSARVLALFERRIRERRPAAYLTQEAWLGNYRFYVDERVIVPRSYIAELLRLRLEPWIAKNFTVRSALDLCTGSGCLAILIARTFARARVDAADISTDALDVAQINVAAYRMKRRVHPVQSDMFGALGGRRYDLIISNPPYVKASVMRKLPLEYRREPRIALAGGTDGLDAVRVILRDASHHLNPHGMLVVETGHNRSAVERAFPRLPFIWPVTSGGDDCVFLLTREDLLRGKYPLPQRRDAQAAKASRSNAPVPARKARRSARAADAKAAQSHRSVRGSGG
jgi:ribosomal protein L3 glutamine methyltransferase